MNAPEPIDLTLWHSENQDPPFSDALAVLEYLRELAQDAIAVPSTETLYRLRDETFRLTGGAP